MTNLWQLIDAIRQQTSSSVNTTFVLTTINLSRIPGLSNCPTTGGQLSLRSTMSPPTDNQIKKIVKTLNDRGQFRSIISLASTPSRASYEGMLRDVYSLLSIEKAADQKHAEAFYSIRRSKIGAPFNRYRDIYAFDRTAVRIPNDLNKWIGTGDGVGEKGVGDVEELNDEDSAYLNANVIADGKGSWWVACQVCPVARPLWRISDFEYRLLCQQRSILS